MTNTMGATLEKQTKQQYKQLDLTKNIVTPVVGTTGEYAQFRMSLKDIKCKFSKFTCSPVSHNDTGITLYYVCIHDAPQETIVGFKEIYKYYSNALDRKLSFGDINNFRGPLKQYSTSDKCSLDLNISTSRGKLDRNFSVTYGNHDGVKGIKSIKGSNDGSNVNIDSLIDEHMVAKEVAFTVSLNHELKQIGHPVLVISCIHVRL
jgi:hypothetical protein